MNIYRGALLFLIVSLLAACAGETDEHPLIGYVEARWTYIAAPENGRIVGQLAEPGLEVLTGDLLFRLDRDAQQAAVDAATARVAEALALSRDLDTGARETEIMAIRSRLEQARAQLHKVALERDRVLPLAEAGLASRTRADALNADVDAARANVEALQRDIAVAREAARPEQQVAASQRIDVARADLALALYNLEQRDVVSAVDGRVEEVFLKKGEFATRGSPVLAVLRRNDLKVRFFVSQEQLAELRVGRELGIRADGLPSPVPARISYIAEAAEYAPPVIYTRELRQKLLFAVDATLASAGDLRPGLPVEVEL